MMFAQANSEHCRHKIFNADWVDRRRAAAARSLFAMIRNTHAAHPAGHGRRVLGQRGGDGRRATSRASIPAPTAATLRTRELTHILMKVETHNHPTAISPFPGAATGSGGEIRDEGATGTRRQAEGGAHRLHRVEPAHSRPRRSRGRRDGIGKPDAHRVARSTIMIEGPIGGAAFNNEFGRPNLAGYFRTFEQQVGGEVRGYHKPIMIAGGVGNIARGPHAQAARSPAGALLDPARRARHADRPGRRRGVVDGDRREHRGPRLRLGAARQRRDRAPRAGSDRPLLAAGRRQSDPVDPRRRRRRTVERAARARARRRRGRRRSTCARSRPRSPACRRARSGATRRRSATCSRSRRERSTRFARSASASAARSRWSARATRRRPARRRRSALRQPAGRHAARRAARQAAEDDARRARTSRATLPPLDLARRRRSTRPRYRVLQLPGGRRQDVPRHDRRPHRRRPVRARPDGRARGRCRSPTSR